MEGPMIKKIVKVSWKCDCGNIYEKDLTYETSYDPTMKRICLLCGLYMLRQPDTIGEVDEDLLKAKWVG